MDNSIPNTGRVIDQYGVVRQVIEDITGAYKVIYTDHALIHAGQAFTVANKMDIATNKVGAISIAVPAGVYAHFKPAGIAASGGPVYVSLLEDYSFVGGSAIVPINRRRVGTPIASTLTVKGAVDISAVAGAAQVSLDMLVIPSSTQGNTKVGAAGSIAEEWVLKPETNYLLTFTNAAASTTTVGYSLFWYEESAG